MGERRDRYLLVVSEVLVEAVGSEAWVHRTGRLGEETPQEAGVHESIGAAAEKGEAPSSKLGVYRIVSCGADDKEMEGRALSSRGAAPSGLSPH